MEKEESLKIQESWQGKIEIKSRVKIENKQQLSIAYTPQVAYACLEIEKDKDNAYKYTRKHNLAAVITNGSAVLGLGNIGAQASMPVMEGKCVLLKEFADVDAIPICIDSEDPDEIIRTIHLISQSFGAINLEDIAAPHCFYIEHKLKELCDIPVFHDDQHGTAVVVLAALINILKLKQMHEDNCKIVINGAGAAGTAIFNLLYAKGFKNILVCDIEGILHKDMELSAHKMRIALKSNTDNIQGDLKDALKGADIFIGVSKADLLSEQHIALMSKKPVVLALANPNPEISPEAAKKAGAYIIATGRSDYRNQINNLLAFPGIFKGVLASRKKEITQNMLLDAAHAIADIAYKDGLSTEYIIPDSLDKRVVDAVANAVHKSKDYE